MQLPTISGLRAAASSVKVAAFIALVPLYQAISYLPNSNEGIDFRQFYLAALRLVHGHSPYAATLGQLGQHHPFVYPPLSAVIFVPFTVLSLTTASVVFGLICIALTPATLYLSGVRDLRVFCYALAGAPAIVAWQTGNETALLLLLTALVWRYRDQAVVAGALTATAISMKLLMWPLALWLLATRRWRGAAWALLAGALVNLMSWLMIGFGNFAPFLHQSSLDIKNLWDSGYSIAATLAPFGFGHGVGDAVMVLGSTVLVLALAHAGYTARDDYRALTLTICLILVASPIVWDHYLLLLLVPLAIARPHPSWLWMAPVLLWVCPYAPGTGLWQRPLAWAVATAVLAAVTRRGPALPPTSVHLHSLTRKPAVGLEPTTA